MIKLLSGETLLATVINYDDAYLYVTNPVNLKFVSTERGSMMTSTFWIPSSEMGKVFPIKAEHIITYTRSGDQLEEYYVRAVDMMTSVPKEEPEHEEPMLDREEKLEQYRNKLRLVRAAANTVH
jgi:hypothetical protein